MKKALVLALACAFGIGGAAFAAGSISGSWSGLICIDPLPTPTFTLFTSTLTVDYTISGWTFESVSSFDIYGWTDQVFNIDGVLGAFTISSYVNFNPKLAIFGEWYTNAAVNIAGVSLTFESVLSGAIKDVCHWPTALPVPPAVWVGDPWQYGALTGTVVVLDGLYGVGHWYEWQGFGTAVTVEGGVGDFSIMAKLYLNSLMSDIKVKCASSADNYPLRLDTLKPATAECCLCFTSFTINMQFPFCCIELVDVTVGFSCDGFDGIKFCVTDVTFPNLPWMAWDVCITFDDQTYGKTIEIIPSLNLGDFACFTVYADFCTFPEELNIDCVTGVNIYAIGIECEFNGCTFTDLSLTDPTNSAYYNMIYLGGSYWEKFCISCGGDSCCGGAFSFDVCNYFDVNSPMLFDWGLTEIALAFGISSNFDLNFNLTVDTLGLAGFCFGFTVTF